MGQLNRLDFPSSNSFVTIFKHTVFINSHSPASWGSPSLWISHNGWCERRLKLVVYFQFFLIFFKITNKIRKLSHDPSCHINYVWIKLTRRVEDEHSRHPFWISWLRYLPSNIQLPPFSPILMVFISRKNDRFLVISNWSISDMYLENKFKWVYLWHKIALI